MNISIIGTGYVGLVTGLCLADRGHQVSCVDVDPARIAALANGEMPIHEPGLGDLLRRHLGQTFTPTLDVEAAVQDSELTMITVGTPVDDGVIDLRFIREAASTVGRVLARKDSYHVVVVKSAVVPGTTEECVGPILESTSGKRCGVDIGLGMNPEFLREGEAVDDFQHPDRIVLGATDPRAHAAMARIYAAFDGVHHVRTNPRTAEMIKYASNSLLATLISFSNEIGNLCSAAAGVDAVEVLEAVHLDKRISPTGPDGTRVRPALVSYLKAGCGFGGSCFPKDVRALIGWGAQRHRPTALLAAVLQTNENQAGEMLALLERHFPTLAGVRVAVLGLSFKAGTDDVREAPALRVVPKLTAQGALVVAYDPVANQQARRVLGDDGIQYVSSLAQAIRGADAIALLTAWPEFQQLPELLDGIACPPVVVDGRRVLDKARLKRYEGIGLGESPAAGVMSSARPQDRSSLVETER